MPSSSSIKKLYLAKSVGELNKKAEFNMPVVTDVTKCSKSAHKLFKEARLNDEKGDEELAYVQYVKFISFYSNIRKAKSYEVNKKFCTAILGDTPLVAMKRAEELQANLVRRYDFQEEAKRVNAPAIETENKKEKEISVEKGNKNNLTEGESKLTVHSNSIKKDKKDEESITSLQLFEMINNSDISLLVFDARPANDFAESHMKHDFCVNIPEEILLPGITAVALENKLPTNSFSCWRKRSVVDFVIVHDWESTLSSLTIKHPLHTLIQAIYKWDMNTFLKSNPLILEGGYENWLLHYPALTTNAKISHITSHIIVPSLSNTNLDIDYPDLDKTFIETPENSPKTFVNCINDKVAPTQPKFPVVNRDIKPPKDGIIMNGNLTDSLDRTRKQSNESVFDNEITTKPLIDRKLKPKSSMTTSKLPDSSHNVDSKMDSISQTLLKEESVLEENIKFEAERLEKEKEFEILRHKKLYEAEEAMRMEIQRQEEELLAKVQALERQAETKELEYHKLKEENDQIKQELYSIKEKGAETEKLKKLQEREAHMKHLTEEVARLREIRKLNEKKEAEKRKMPVKPEHQPVKSIDKQILKDDRKSVNLPDTYIEDIEHFVPLKDHSAQSTPTSHGGLSRSHSSPNIAQLVENEGSQAFMPKFDRSLKPTRVSESFSPTVSRSFKPEEIHAARLRNLQPIYGNQGEAVTGLRNLGNTCFMNAVIQCLGLSIPLSSYFTTGRYRDDIVRDGRHSTKGEVAEEFAAVIWALWAGVYKSIAPRDFKSTVSKYLSVCVGYEQQDSHEFLIVLLEKLHGDLNKSMCSQPNQQLDLDNLPSEIAQEKFWNNHKRMNQSVISELFEGLMQSTLNCLHCNKISDSYEVLSFLSLPITSSIRCSLTECLELFLKAETMTGDGAWHCPQCKQKQEARKRTIICHLPEILVIHLKRFSFEGMWRRKLQTYVDFPLELQMKPYVPNPLKNQSLVYKLYGIVNHYGTMEGGHYIAFCKNTTYDRWYKYDDHEVFAMSESDVKTSAAYILFYSCIDFRNYLEH